LNARWPLSSEGLLRQALFLGVALALGGGVYLVAAWGLGLDEIRALGRLIRRWRLRAETA
jgi:hypothetical protein